jgi:Ca-activated chloride channel family protein
MDLFGIHWAAFSYSIYSPFIVLSITFILFATRGIEQFYKGLAHERHRKVLIKNFSSWRLWIKAAFFSLCLIFLFLALLRPQWNKKEVPLVQEGRNLIVLFDISRSMLGEDVKPNRLEFAKLKIRSLIDMLSFERVGLVIFSGSAYVQCPLTTDYKAFLTFLNYLSVETIGSGGTALDQAFNKVLEMFSSSKSQNKLVLLLTDGEDFSQNFGATKEIAKKENIHLFALGIGSPEGAPVPIIDFEGTLRGHEVDKNGNIVLSRLNSSLLEGICSLLNGVYIPARLDDSDLEEIVERIKGYEKEKFEEKNLALYEEKYFYCAITAFIFLLLEWII